MRSAHPGPSPQEKRVAAYLEGLARAAGHRDREAPLKDYCRGLLLPGQRQSIEPMAARLHPDRVQPNRPVATRSCCTPSPGRCCRP